MKLPTLHCQVTTAQSNACYVCAYPRLCIVKYFVSNQGLFLLALQYCELNFS